MLTWTPVIESGASRLVAVIVPARSLFPGSEPGITRLPGSEAARTAWPSIRGLVAA